MSVPYKKILVPLDGSELAKQALPHAEELAVRMGASLVLMQVVESNLDRMMVAPGFSVTIPDDRHVERLVEEADVRLADQVGRLAHLHVAAEAMIDVGDAASKIVDYASTHGVDLIVISTHGYSGLTRWRHGSVTTKVLAAATCPVLVIRPMS
jgi:nucleotide-binding universal stress UspA family protein